MTRRTSTIALLTSIAVAIASFFAFGSPTPATATPASAIYWANFDNKSMGTAGIDGSSPNQSLIPSGVINSRGLAVDANYLYWVNQTGSIGRSDLDGTNVNQTFITTGGNFITGVAVDANYIY